MAIFSSVSKKEMTGKETPPVGQPVQVTSTVGIVIPGIIVKGEILGKGDIKIEGVVEGKINLEGLVSVSSKGEVKGEIAAINVAVAGRVEGNVTAREKAEIQPSGQVQGDISAARIIVAEGAQINGSVKITKGTSSSS